MDESQSETMEVDPPGSDLPEQEVNSSKNTLKEKNVGENVMENTQNVNSVGKDTNSEESSSQKNDKTDNVRENSESRETDCGAVERNALQNNLENDGESKNGSSESQENHMDVDECSRNQSSTEECNSNKSLGDSGASRDKAIDRSPDGEKCDDVDRPENDRSNEETCLIESESESNVDKETEDCLDVSAEQSEKDESEAIKEKCEGSEAVDRSGDKDIQDATDAIDVLPESISDSSDKENTNSTKDSGRGVIKKKGKGGDDEDLEIMEIPVEKKKAELVDLADEETESKVSLGATDKGSGSEDSGTESSSKGLKLRSLASLVDTSESQTGDVGGNESIIANPGTVLANPEAFGAVGEIVEHKDMFGDSSAGGLPLRISNVVGGEDCITGLAMDEERDMLSVIQISSVTTLIDPISPEDPNKGLDQEGEPQDEKADNEDGAEESGIKIVCAESLASKELDADKSQESSGPKIRLSSAVSEVAKDVGVEDSSAPSVVHHVLRSILTMPRDCLLCEKKVVCEFRITKKGESGTFAFLCSSDCRTKWTSSLPPTESVEKPRLIFEKLCGMCNKDLTTSNRSGQFSWETREFCSEDCLTSHLEEVANRCHMCFETVRPVYIGKYCVRFGSDIHQFCSNSCLERYKSKIKVCCYCQKNVENVSKVTSPANKEYCSMKCLKRAQRRDIGQQNYSEQHPCTVCQTKGLNRYEFLMNGDAQQLCSDPCLNVFKYVNKVKAVTCCLCIRVMNAEDVSHYLYHGGHQLRVFCSDSCVNVFILSARRIVNCDFCKVKKYNFDMIHRQVDEDFREYYYCSLQCLKARDQPGGKTTTSSSNKSSTTSAGGVASGNISSSSSVEAPMAVCSMCSATAKAQFHMVMSDNTLRSFCRYECAARYKSTFGYLVPVDGSQAKDTAPPKTASAPTIRPKPTSQLTAKSPDSSPQQPTKAAATAASACSPEALQATADILKMLIPPAVENKTTMCKPATCTKGVYCKPHPWHRHTQTDMAGIDNNLSSKDYPPVLPVPIPCYVPTPMCMYNAPFPVPIFVPIPLPVPIFLPTTAKTSKDIMAMMKKIEDEFPTDPIQAEMLLLARQSMEQNKDGVRSEVQPEEPTEEPTEEPSSPVDNFTSYSGDDEAVNDEANNDEVNSADEACLNTMEEDLPRYPLRDADVTSGFGDSESPNDRGKRKKRGRGRPRKKARRDSDDDSRSVSDAEEDPDFMPEPETVLEEEFQGPFLNKMYGLTAWKSWVTKKNAELAGVSSMRSMKLISEDLLTMNCDELNYALCLFLKDLRKPNGEMYQPDTIYYLLLGIQQHLFENSRTDCIFMDFGFEKFTNSLDEITRTFWVSPTLPGISSMVTLGVTRITEAMLWECRQLGAHTPQVLLNTLFYFNTKVFKLKTVEDHLAMSFVQIVKQWRRSSMGRDGSGTRTTLLKYYPKKSSNDGEKPRQNYEMHENRDDPLRCPVKLYEFYLSKCPESVRNQRHVYYVYPERSCVPDSPVWFSTQAVHATSIAKMLNRALMVREVQEAFAE